MKQHLELLIIAPAHSVAFQCFSSLTKRADLTQRFSSCLLFDFDYIIFVVLFTLECTSVLIFDCLKGCLNLSNVDVALMLLKQGFPVLIRRHNPFLDQVQALTILGLP